MTNKQIIIDGVDVSKCKYFDCDSIKCKAEYYVRHGYEIVEYDSCRENPNCYYKQLKRKEQECNKLKQTLADIKKIALILAPMTDEYENCYDRDRCFECDFTEDCQYKLVTNILQIIGDE